MMKKKVSCLSIMVIVMFFGMAFLSVPSQAKTVSPSGKKDATDTKNILKALKKTGKLHLNPERSTTWHLRSRSQTADGISMQPEQR